MADKIGRNKRKPAQQRYVNEERWEKNKSRKVKKETKRQERLGLNKSYNDTVKRYGSVLEELAK